MGLNTHWSGCWAQKFPTWSVGGLVVVVPGLVVVVVPGLVVVVVPDLPDDPEPPENPPPPPGSSAKRHAVGPVAFTVADIDVRSTVPFAWLELPIE